MSDNLRPTLSCLLLVEVLDEVGSGVSLISKIVEVIEDRGACCHDRSQAEKENEHLHNCCVLNNYCWVSMTEIQESEEKLLTYEELTVTVAFVATCFRREK